MIRRLLVGALFCVLALGCKRYPPVALNLTMNEDGGCAELKPNPKFGKFVCWGPDKATTRAFPGGDPTKITLGPKRACGYFGMEKVACWEGQGPPVDIGIKSRGGVKLAIGAHHLCAVTQDDGEHFECQGDDGDGEHGTPSEWLANPIRLVAAGEGYTCVAWERGAGILCRGKGMPREPVLVGSEIVDLRAGPRHACATTKAGRLYCWGKNDSGQLGDGTTNDAAAPMAVPGVDHVVSAAVGARHTCALLGNRTVWCWGANDHHQLANGMTTTNPKPAMVLGALGVWEIAAAGDATCARLGDEGEIRCWGQNDHYQLGDGSTVEHTVPAHVKFR